MKYLKLYESKENREVLSSIKKNFISLYDETMVFSQVTINSNRRIKKDGGDRYILSATYNSAINEKNHHIFIAMFQFLSKCDVNFHSSNNRVHIYINDLDNFKNKLQEQVDIVDSINKYNI